MKNKHFIILFFIILFTTCKKDVPITGDRMQMATNPDWTTENFKTVYTIQFPADYDGEGMVGFEGNTFSKNRKDNKVKMSYMFCTNTFCYDFGPVLNNSNQTHISTTDQNGYQVTLNKKIKFCNNNSIFGIYFFNDDSIKTGKLYWKQDNNYKEALTVFYKKDFQFEVEQIIKTIRLK